MLESWILPSLVAFLATIVAILCYRKLQPREVPLTIPILTRLFYAFAAMAFVQGLNLVIMKPKVNLFKIDYVLLLIIGVSTFIFDIFAQIGLYLVIF